MCCIRIIHVSHFHKLAWLPPTWSNSKKSAELFLFLKNIKNSLQAISLLLLPIIVLRYPASECERTKVVHICSGWGFNLMLSRIFFAALNSIQFWVKKISIHHQWTMLNSIWRYFFAQICKCVLGVSDGFMDWVMNGYVK